MPSSRSSLELKSFRPEREEYLKHERLSAELAGSDTAFANASHRANQQASLFLNASDELSDARNDASRTAKRLHRQRSSRIRSALFPKSSREKVARCEREHLVATERAANAEARTKSARISLEQFEFERRNLRNKAATLAAAQQRQKNILDNVFNGAAVNEEEGKIAQEMKSLAVTLREAKQALKLHTSALQLLQSAKTDLEYACRLLRNLQTDTDQEDLFDNVHLEFMSGANAQINRKNAKKLAQSAQKKVAGAAEINGGLPLAREAKVGGKVVDVFRDSEFSTVFGTPYERFRIDKAAMCARRALDIVKQNIPVQRYVVDGIVADVTKFQQTLDSQKKKLSDVRARLLKEAN